MEKMENNIIMDGQGENVDIIILCRKRGRERERERGFRWRDIKFGHPPVK